MVGAHFCAPTFLFLFRLAGGPPLWDGFIITVGFYQNNSLFMDKNTLYILCLV
jgi:hypothetical protein